MKGKTKTKPEPANKPILALVTENASTVAVAEPVAESAPCKPKKTGQEKLERTAAARSLPPSRLARVSLFHVYRIVGF